MSQVTPQMVREPVVIPPRPSVSDAKRARILAAYDGMCSFAGCASTKDLEIDHIDCRAVSGDDSDENLAPLCATHHAKKTKRDRKRIAKTNGMSTLRLDIPKKKSKRPLRGPGFPKHIRQHMDGRIEKVNP